MKSTGIIRNIDELGRIVIPKEIRHELRLSGGTSLEIYVSNDQIILKKHSPLKSIKEIAQSLSDVLSNSLNYNIVITDLFNIIASSGLYKKELINKEISSNMEESIKRREKLFENYKKEIVITNDCKLESTYAISTIISNSNVVGLILIFDENNSIDQLAYKIINVVSNFIGKYLEE